MQMHAYQADGRDRVTVILAGASVLLVWALTAWLGDVSGALSMGVDGDSSLSWWLGPPSLLGGYAMLSWLFERYAWKWNILRTLGIVKIVNLNGEWEGFVKSSYDEYASEIRISVAIAQRWSKISIRMNASQSRSSSTLAVLKTRDVIRPELVYVYENEPQPDAAKTMHAHKGTVTLEFHNGTLSGNYYTGRDRSTVGKIELRRVALSGRSPDARRAA